MSKPKTSKKETIVQERHVQRFKGYHKTIMCIKCHDQMNNEIQQIIEQVKEIGVDEDETLVLTETGTGVEISKVQTKFADRLDLEHSPCIRI